MRRRAFLLGAARVRRAAIVKVMSNEEEFCEDFVEGL
jgi:hypothetical protein